MLPISLKRGLYMATLHMRNRGVDSNIGVAHPLSMQHGMSK